MNPLKRCHRKNVVQLSIHWGIALLLLFVTTDLPGKNLKLLRTVSPANFELMDIEIEGKLMVISGGLGGSVLYDISDPLQPSVNPARLTRLRLHPCDFGRTYKWSLGNGLAIGTARECGLGIWDLSDLESVTFLTHLSPMGGHPASYEDVEIYGDYAIVAAHAGGVQILDISQPHAPSLHGTIHGGNAWSVAVHDSLVYVADAAQGLRIIDISRLESPKELAVLSISGTAKDVKYQDGTVYLAAGNGGIDIVDVTDPSNPVRVANAPSAGLASRVAVSGQLIGVSAWSEFQVFQWDGSSLRLVGYKNTGGRVMATGTPGGRYFYSAEWSKLRVYEYGTIASADLDISPMHVRFPHLETGQRATKTVTLTNNGNTRLDITSLGTSHEDFSVSPSITAIPAGVSDTLTLTYTANASNAHGNLSIVSNDPDENVKAVELLGNAQYHVEPGEPAPEFSLPVVANGSGQVQLSDQKGTVIVLAFFASW